MVTKPEYYYRQSAVIPFRRGPSGLEILLINTRKGRRWIVPKGIVEPDLSEAESAAREAYEEAGVNGRVLPGPIGSYEYGKWGGTCRVAVYAMEVEQELDDWPEDFRQRQWLGPAEAADRVSEAELERLISQLPSLLT
jgi:phosphohistidine phosphatase